MGNGTVDENVECKSSSPAMQAAAAAQAAESGTAPRQASEPSAEELRLEYSRGQGRERLVQLARAARVARPDGGDGAAKSGGRLSALTSHHLRRTHLAR